MRTHREVEGSLLALGMAITVALAHPGTADAARYRPGELIVKLKAGMVQPLSKTANGSISLGHAGLDSLNRRHTCRSVGRVFGDEVVGGPGAAGMDRLLHLRFSDAADVTQLAREYDQSGLFEFVEPNYEYRLLAEYWPNDPFFGWQVNLWNTGSLVYQDSIKAKAGADIRMPSAWNEETGDSAIIVGIIDSGCRMRHPEFAGRFWTNPGETPGNKRDDDRNGLVDDVNGWNFADGNSNLADTLGHGTAVAGVLAATGNNGMLGAGIDWKCRLMILRVFAPRDTGATALSMAQAITYAAKMGARVINLSLGNDQSARVIQQAVAFAASRKVVMVAAAGNENLPSLVYPARYPECIGVGAVSIDDRRCNPFWPGGGSGGSNYGTGLSVVAPGNLIQMLSNKDDTSFTSVGAGTSLAAPQVSGIASLLLAQQPTRTPDQVRTIIEATADDQVGDPKEDVKGWDKYYGWGRVNAYRALTYGKPVVASGRRLGAVRPELMQSALRLGLGPKPAVAPGRGVFGLDGRRVAVAADAGRARAAQARAQGVLLVRTSAAWRWSSAAAATGR